MATGSDAGFKVRVANEANRIKGGIKRLFQDFDPSKSFIKFLTLILQKKLVLCPGRRLRNCWR